MYAELKAWHEHFGTNLEILLFPSDEFGGQELPTAEIGPFVHKMGLPTAPGSGVTLMAKVKTNGPSTDDVWKILKAAFPGDVRWNFAALFVVGPDGVPIGRFSAKQLPEAYAAVESLVSRA